MTWVDYATAWAKVKPLSGIELWKAQQINALVTHNVNIRFRSGVLPDMRVTFKGRVLNIVSVVNDEERNREMDLVCMEHVA